jgi:predicted hydrocarbon binding protein
MTLKGFLVKMKMVEQANLPRSHPVAYLTHILAMGKFDPVYARFVEGELHVDTNSLGGLAGKPLELSDYPLRELISLLAKHLRFQDATQLAGKSAFSQLGITISSSSHFEVLFQGVKHLKRILPSTRCTIEEYPALSLLVRNSPFVVDMSAGKTCGFVSGFLTSAFINAGMPKLRVVESICRSMDNDGKFCLFEVVS